MFCLFILWNFACGRESWLFLSSNALCGSKMTQGIDIIKMPPFIWKCNDRENVPNNIGMESTVWSVSVRSKLNTILVYF